MKAGYVIIAIAALFVLTCISTFCCCCSSEQRRPRRVQPQPQHQTEGGRTEPANYRKY